MKPLVVFADNLVAAIEPARAEPRLDPSILTEPAVGVAPAASTVVGCWCAASFPTPSNKVISSQH